MTQDVDAIREAIDTLVGRVRQDVETHLETLASDLLKLAERRDVHGAPDVKKAAVEIARAVAKGGIRLGILDNSKGNADHLLRFIVEGVKALMPVASVLALRKDSVSLPAPKEILEQLAAGSDYVITAMAD